MDNSAILSAAAKNNLPVTFAYITREGENRVRVGYVETVGAQHVIIWDAVKKDYRTSRLSGVQGVVEILGFRVAPFG